MIESSHTRSLLSGKELTRVRAMAIRRGTWYRTLNKTERPILSLTIRIVTRIKSNVLLQVLVSIIAKLQVEDKCGLTASSHSWGRPIAEKISMIAQAWGNASAVKWSADRAFIRFLEVIYLNTPSTYSTVDASLLK